MKRMIGTAVFLALFTLAQASGIVLQLGEGSGALGTTHNVVQVSVANDTAIKALQFEIYDVPDFIRPDSVWTTARSSGFAVQYQEDSLGVFRVLLLDMSGGRSIAKGSGALLNIGYTVLPGADSFNSIDLVFYSQPVAVDQGNQKMAVTTIPGKFFIGNTAVVLAESAKPDRFSLAQNFPNPFNPSTRIAFTLPWRERVELEVFNLLGQRIRRLAGGEYAAGVHEVIWNGLDDRGAPASGGVYIYRLRAGTFVDYRRMIYMR